MRVQNSVGTYAYVFDNVCYVSRKDSIDEDLNKTKITIRNTFAYNPDSKSAAQTAARWSGQKSDVEIVQLPNEPFTVQIIGIDVRSEGGRAFKVIDEHNRMFDLREDQLLSAIQNHGISPGGYIKGKFVWGTWESQTRLVLVGGDMHQTMLENNLARKRLEKQNKNIVFHEGTIYQKRDKSLVLFLGNVKLDNKSFFAFVDMPTAPVNYLDKLSTMEPEDTAYYRFLKQISKIERQWTNMSWLERCEYMWVSYYDSVNEWMSDREDGDKQTKRAISNNCWSHHSSIILLSSKPKNIGYLEEDNIAHDLANKIRLNVDFKHNYISGLGVDFAHVHWLSLNKCSCYYCKSLTDEQLLSTQYTRQCRFYQSAPWNNYNVKTLSDSLKYKQENDDLKRVIRDKLLWSL